MHFSKQKKAGRADVHVVPIKQVKKPKGAKPGLVWVTGGRSLHLRREEKRLQRLLESRLDEGRAGPELNRPPAPAETARMHASQPPRPPCSSLVTRETKDLDRKLAHVLEPRMRLALVREWLLRSDVALACALLSQVLARKSGGSGKRAAPRVDLGGPRSTKTSRPARRARAW